MPGDPAAFLSYAQSDDRFTKGFITGFRERLADAVYFKTGVKFEIFQDRNSLGWGRHWPRRIDAALSTSLFLIPFVTPTFMGSPACLDEVRRFLEVESAQGGSERILPVYFAATPEMDEEDLRVRHDVARALYERQYRNLQDFAGKRVRSPAVDKVIMELADEIRIRLREDGSGGHGPGPPVRRVVNGPPDFVPAEVRDREPVVAELLQILDRPGAVLIELEGDPGIGKTAVIAKLFKELDRPVVLDYLTTLGYPPVSAISVLTSLAGAHPDHARREPLADLVRSSDLTTLDKLDAVLRELGSAEVLLALDNVERLLDHGTLRDPLLGAVLEGIAEAGGHGVRILLVTTEHWNHRLVRSTPLADGLSDTDLAEFVADLDARREATVAPLSKRDAERLRQITAGRPRNAELVFDILSAQGRSLSGLATEPRPVADVLAEGLNPDEIAVLRALAVYPWPVEPGAIAHLTGGDRVSATLAELTRRRIIRRLPPDRYFRPADDAGLPAGDAATPDLRRRAAEYFEAKAGRAGRAEHLDDLGDYFDAIELRIAAGDAGEALDIVTDIDERYLKNWGHSNALITPLTRLYDLVTDPDDQVLAGFLLGGALADEGRLPEAVEILLAALGVNESSGDTERQLELLVLLGSCHLRNGDGHLAQIYYQGALDRAPGRDRPIAVPQARLGRALCRMEAGGFAEALADVETAKRELSGCVADESSRVELSIQLALCEADAHLEFDHHRVALDLLDGARATAERIGADLPAGECHELAARAWSAADHLANALKAAEAAFRIAARSRNPDRCRSAGVTLATVLLLRGWEADALAAARTAARYAGHRGALDASAMLGVAAYRCREPTTAGRAFAAAERMAGDLHGEPELDSYRVLDYLGIALAGLAVLHDGAREREAAEALQAARRLSGDQPGANRRRQQLVRTLTDGLAGDALPLVRRAVE